jgi:AraC-like DNA-binding protein
LTLSGVVAVKSAHSALLLGGQDFQDGMKTIFSTENVHPRERFDSWHHIACRDLVPHDSKPACREMFQAELRSGIVGRTHLILFQNSPMEVSHTPRHIARGAMDDLFICRQFAGKVKLEQYGRQVVLEPGDLTLIDPRVPYTGAFSAGSQLLVLKTPRELVEARIGRCREIAAYRIPPVQDAAFLSSFIALLPSKEKELSPEAKEVVNGQVLDLLAIVLSKLTTSGPSRLSAARSLVRMTVGAAIEARLQDPRLDAEAIAAAAGVSVRYANSILAEEDSSIIRLIQSRRLEQCRKALADRSQAHRTVSEIAYGWGFSDMTHFGRKFRAAYGMSPRDYRKSWSE